MATVIRRHSVVAYFALAYLTAALAFVAFAGPGLSRDGSVRPADLLPAFPLMVVGVALAGAALTAVVGGRRGLRELRGRLGRWRVGARWYAAVLVPPALILVALVGLSRYLSPAFAPNLFVLGLLFGVVAGVFEEIGWMGYAYPRLRAGRGALGAGVLLGVLWGAWHLPVVDSLGAASPHGAAWPPFFLAFVLLVTALRVLIVWVYEHTGSLPLCQLVHASSTGSLVVLRPVGVTPGEEALWYGVYAGLLWLVVGVLHVWRGWSSRLTAAGPARPAL
jgi:membrane protease YdiL (CAAX protease family)